MRPNKELKLTKPSQDGASQLNSGWFLGNDATSRR